MFRKLETVPLVFRRARIREDERNGHLPVVIGDVDIGDVAGEHQAVFVTRDGALAYKRLCGALEARHLGPRDHLPWPNPEIRDESGGIDECPFPGLFAFDERYAAVYFGREPEIKVVVEQLNEMRRKGEPRLLMIVGGSGSGKSSLLKAGVLPRLKHKAADSDWLVLPVLRYGELAYGDNAFFDALADIIAAEYPSGSPGSPDRRILREQLSNGDVQHVANVFWEAVHDLAIARGARSAAVLLPVDQFEELLAPSAGTMATNFLAFLKAVCERPNPRLLIVGTMRSDYLDIYERHPSALRAPLFFPWRLEPFPRERLADVIVNPTRRTHIKIDGDLLDVLKQDTPSSDALPLLAFTLRDLYKKCSADGCLHLSEYKDQGGMEGSIRTTVDKIIPKDSLSGSVAAAVRLSFVKHLAQVNEKDEFVRRTANWNDIDETAKPILSRFVNERLLVRSEHGGEIQIEVAHEAMLRCWDQLSSWLRTSADILRWRRDVRRDQESDKKNGRQWTGLRPAQLAVAREWHTKRRDELNDDEVRWIRQGVRRSQLRIAAIAAVLIFVGSLALFAWRQMINANKSEEVARLSLEKQLKMFTEATKLAGAIAAGVRNQDTGGVQSAFQELTEKDAPLVRTPLIDKRIEELGSAINSWIPIAQQPADPLIMSPVQVAALDLAKAVRAAWESQTLEGPAKAMTREIIAKPACDRAIAVTQKIATRPPESSDIAELERLYWGELVFFEPAQVAQAMVTFRQTSLGAINPGSKELQKAADELKTACNTAANGL